MEPVNNFGTQDNGKTAGIISYFTIIGWLIAYFGFHQNNKTRLGSYQLRQTLLLFLAFVIIRYGLSLTLSTIWLTTGFLSLYSLMGIVNLIFFVLWIIGLIGAISGQERPIPVFGEWAQRLFPNL